ncbi:BZIP transcription factor [Diaporthe helianthi]|uniref:BZIP transcription factor n=1 Tax=Diaporthe helianthi TaxID=158607 RepID=A0A2P5I5L3_DIAHE|nr:BZIP transcription factor [Diaporthe helianthi]
MKRERATDTAATSPAQSPAASQRSTPAPSYGSGPGPEAKKRKSAAPGSRGVANLTPEQLAKKRANDREAQRAIRERTKMTIENLENRIRELTSQQPYQELQAALRAKEAVEAENADIKRRLASVISMLQPLINSSQNEQQPVLPSPGQSYLNVSTTTDPAQTTGHHNNTSTPSSAASPTQDPYTAQWNSGASTSSGPMTAQAQAYKTQLNQQRHDLAHGLEFGTERLGLDFLLDQTQRARGIHNVTNGTAQESPAFRQHAPATNSSHPNSPFANSVGRGGADYVTAPRSGGMDSNIDPALQGAIDPALSNYSTPIKNCPPTCPLDSLLLDFLHERRQRAAEGLPTQEIIGPRYPSVSSLLNPLKESHPLSKVFIDILQTFPDISQLPERVAVLYVMFLLMRWQIHPSQENYERLPGFMRPLPGQLYTPHPAWLDSLPFSAMRERLITDYSPPETFPFEHFFIPFTTTLSLNWPYEDTDTLLQSAESDELMINPVFERHLRRPENWTLGDAFARAFPALEGTYNLKVDGPGVSHARGGRNGGRNSSEGR